MKSLLVTLCAFASLLTALPSFSQSNTTLKQQLEYLSSYENITLGGNALPVPMPYNRWIDPAGTQLYFGDKNRENHALDCALSPDGKWVAVEGRYSIVIISTATRDIVCRYVLKTHFVKESPMNTFSGIAWRTSGDGYELFWSTAVNGGRSYVVRAGWNGKEITVLNTYTFLAAAPAETALPNELLTAEEPGGPVLFVVVNGNNTLDKIDVRTGTTLWSVPTGVAPFGITAAAGKLYVTNWAGSVPDSNDTDVAGVPWGRAKVDPRTGATREGTVSVFDPHTGTRLKDIVVGLHPNDVISSADGKFIYVANGNSDIVSVINTGTDAVAERISVRLLQKKNRYFGDTPNGLAVTADGATLFVANGMDNALAVVRLGKRSSSASRRQTSRVEGFIPTGAYPGSVAIGRDSTLFVANIEAEGARIPSISAVNGAASYNSHRMMASVSVIPIPDTHQLRLQTRKVEKINQMFRLALTERVRRKNTTPVPVPIRIGEPSVFKHVVYIIKENRTYDQVLGDVSSGDGDSTLCVFGRNITPNAHQLTEEFHLLDNFYASGKCSAEGHQWTDMSIVTDYIEKNVRAWFRSYPHVQEDALVYAPTGFLWDNAVKHGKRVKVYGEACIPRFDKKATWTSIYNGFMTGDTFAFKNTTTIKPLERLLSPNYPGYNNHLIPDILRAKAFTDELDAYETMEGDALPELMVVALPNDHTGGTRPDLPTPRAMVADNDLALGRIIEALSKSRFWKNTVVFVTEDDSQAGWDHVSAYRTVGMVLSPYSKMKTTVRTNYNQTSMVRTIEQILGIPPMNIGDATAMPMFDCFSFTADRTPYAAVPNRIPLDEMNKSLSELHGAELDYALKSLDPQFDQIDAGEDDLFNRILWFAMKGEHAYPANYSGTDDDEEGDEDDMEETN